MPPQSDQSAGPQTTLAQRRIQRKAKESQWDSSNSSSKNAQVPTETQLDQKPKAVWRIFCCIAVNVTCIVGLWLIQQLLGLVVSLRESRSCQAQPEPLADLESAPGRGSAVQWWAVWFLWLFSHLVRSLWLLPFFLVTRLVNCLWFQDIASAALRHLGRASVAQSFSRGAADFLLAVLLETVFLVQSFTVKYLVPVPYIAPLLTYVHVSLLYSLYCFEYYWMSAGVELKQRLTRIESNWPYFLGFGLPLTLLTLSYSNFIVSGCLFGAFFPFFIISSFQAKPFSQSLQRGDYKLWVFHVFAPSLYICNKVSLYGLNQARSASLLRGYFKLDS